MKKKGEHNAIDMSGRRYGKLMVVGLGPPSPGGDRRWFCLCDCGTETLAIGASLRRGLMKTCGCGKRSKKHIAGARYGQLTIIKMTTKKHGSAYTYLCQCDCGKTVHRAGYSLEQFANPSCGCQWHLKPIGTWPYRVIYHPEYKIWAGMRIRCTKTDHASYDAYGGRGISVCRRWDNFYAFLQDMGMRPSKKHSIDRVDVNGDYTPENTRWATRLQQANNTRKTIYINWRGGTVPLAEWARRFKLQYKVAYAGYRKGRTAHEILQNRSSTSCA